MTSIIFLISIAFALWLGYKLGKWRVIDEQQKQMDEAIRLLGSSFGLFPKPNEDLSMFRKRIRAWLQSPPKGGCPSWIPESEYRQKLDS